MVTLLRKIFIKNYDKVNDPKVREKHGLLASIGGIFTNIVLFVIKLIIGIFAGSMAIISDAINNLTDLISCVVSLFGFKLANKPADEDHPYGHERLEYITGMIVSFIIIAVGILLCYTSVKSLINKEIDPTFTIASFIVLGVAIVGKILLGLFYNGIGNAINSVSIKASRQDSFNDAISTTVVLIATIIKFFIPSLWWLDPALSIAISLFILYSGIKLVGETVSPLIGLTPDSEFVQSITKEVLSNKEVLGVHDVICHSYGPSKIFMTLHVEVDGYANIMEIHDVIDNIEMSIGKKFGVEITIHMDPIDTKNEEIPIIRKQISEVLSKIDKRITFHDLRLVSGPTHTNVLFDVVIPVSLKINIDYLHNLIKENVKVSNKKYNFIIKNDTNYTC
ncbi:MAG: cation transporter [Bacilli bacterium]|nr:cation transporter [Bacilli bacterium]